MYNVVNPDDIVNQYGADTLRLYEMFLGPLTDSKPWDTSGIEGVHRFLRKLWRLHFNTEGKVDISDNPASDAELKILNKTIKKINYDIENFSFNTSVSAFMICVNELTDLKCNKREVLEKICILISPFAPHIAEELWSVMGHQTSIFRASYPIANEKYLVEDTKNYPVSFNGKTRFTIEMPANATVKEIEEAALAHEVAKKWLDGKLPKKVIVVPGKIINVVI